MSFFGYWQTICKKGSAEWRKPLEYMKIRRASGPWRVRLRTSSFCSLDLVFRRLGPWNLFLGTDRARHTRGALGPIPPQTTRPGGARIRSEGGIRSLT